LDKGFLNTGIERVRADVVGFKEVGGFHRSKIEVIAVEVKNWQWKYTKANIDQAKRASVFAHKCYLAAPRKFSPDEIESAVEKDIGLFEIRNRKKLIEILPAPIANPDEHKITSLLNHLHYYKCSICDCLINSKLLEVRGFYVYNKYTEDEYDWKWQFICSTCLKRIRERLGVARKEDTAELWEEIYQIRKQIKKLSAPSG
jgi:hypothetical protein